MNYKITIVISANSLEDAEDVATEIRGYIQDNITDDNTDLVAHTVEPE